ncbi:MAG TPA: metallopeptidase family protein [Candidatus Deferrimicrobiaceae bacterium]|jgi:predicted Zn-dependent protease with MMP-like domain
MRPSRFDRILAGAIEALPAEFRDALDDLAIVVEGWPPDDLLDDLGVPEVGTIYGFYQGTPLPERSVGDPYRLPDVISIYQGPLEEDFPDPAELQRQIRITLLHEIGHYFGLDEEALSQLGYG